MNALVALLLFASLAQTGIFAAASCGKGRLKVNFRQEKILTVPRVTSGTCRYRIRAARGLHVQLKLDAFSSESPGFSVYDANVRPFSWRKAKELPLTETSSTDRTALSFETSVIGIQVDAAESTSPLSITYTSVIPSSGSFGYDLEAKRKRQAIRTPGFPRIALPSGVRSRYYIHTSSPFAITITFRRMETSPGDYIDLYDGDAYLGRRSGKMGKKSSNEYDAFSGNLTVYLHTETATTKGFKAFVQLTDKVRPVDTTTDSHEDGPAPRLRCHQGTKVVAQQTTITDQKGEMTCEVGQVCASISMNGTTSDIGGSEQDISSMLLTCVPAAACLSGLCDAMSPPSMGLSSKSCKASCCNTDMCNGSPDSTAMDNSTSLWPFTFENQLHCHQESRVEYDGSVSAGSGGGGRCAEGELCALYVFEGIEKNPYSSDGSRPAARGYSARCAAQSECSSDACQSIPDGEFVTMTSCNVTCCNTDMCNDPGLRPTTPTMSTTTLPPEPTLTCYDIMAMAVPRVPGYLLNNKTAVTCDPQIYSKCARIDATAPGPSGGMTLSFGRCVPASSCDSLDCSSLGPQGTEWKSCLASCCDTDLCNDRPVTRPAGAGLRCYHKSEFVREGAISLGEPSENNYCTDGEVCVSAVFYGTIRDDYNDINEPISGQFVGCLPRSRCDTNTTCATLPNVRDRDADITECRLTCCGSDMCNKPVDTPMPSPYPGPFRRCYDILSTRSGSVHPLNRKEEKTCERFSKCARLDAVATDASGREIVTAYGSCIPSYQCASLDCSILGGTVSGLTLSSCRATCCDSDLCNENEAPPAPETPGPIRCYDILSSRSGGMTVLNKKELMTCTDSDARCLRLDARGKGPYGNTITTSYGGCTPTGTCANLDCELLQSTTAGFNLESCRTRCCTDDLCNEDELSPEYEKYSTTLPPGLSPSTSEAGGVQCYQLLEIRVMGKRMTLPGSEKSPRTCEPGWQCLRVTASASHQRFPSIEMKVAYGTCIPACTNEDACNSIPTGNSGVTIKSCEVSCCDTDLCNGTP